MHDLKFLATNNLSAKGLFYTRMAYKDYAIPEDSLRMMDYWYGDSLYGKVDFNNNVVYPMVNRTNLLQPIPQNASTVLGLFFVSRQIEKLKNEYQALLEISQGTIKPLPGYEDFQVSKSYLPIHERYDQHFSEVMSYFVMEYLPHYSKCISEFRHIIKYYKQFVKEFGTHFPITKTSYILMPTTSVLSTGLIVDLEYSRHSMDGPKEKFFPDCDFEAFQSLAAENGFLMHKNAPWRLTFNVKSDILLDDSGEREDIFAKYYYPAHLEDMFNVYRFLLNSYKLFFRKNPNIFYPYQNKDGIMKNLIKKRKMKKGFLKEYHANDWLDLTYFTRLHELGLKNKENIAVIYNDKPWLHHNYQNLDLCLTDINNRIKQLDERFVSRTEIKDDIKTGQTTHNAGHNHIYEIDEYGNGWALMAYHPETKKIAHRHRIVAWEIQEAQSSCYPHCNEVYSYSGVGPHIHEMIKY